MGQRGGGAEITGWCLMAAQVRAAVLATYEQLLRSKRYGTATSCRSSTVPQQYLQAAEVAQRAAGGTVAERAAALGCRRPVALLLAVGALPASLAALKRTEISREVREQQGDGIWRGHSS
jgi:predicted Fe-S protein YdhL (DUF1289 family)